MNLKDLLFLDVEATGVEEKDRLFQIAYDYQNKEYQSLFKPPLPISCEAMEVTGYTNEDVEEKEKFQDSNFYQKLKEKLENGAILVAHYANFDFGMLEKENLKVPLFIDTLKVARFLDPEAKLKNYRLQYLRYCLKLEIKDAQAHDALGDIRVLKALFERLFKKMLDEYENEEGVIKKMIEISQMPSEIKKFNFGKYKDELVEIVFQKDKGYLEWLYEQKKKQALEGEIDEDWIFTLKKFLDLD